MGTLSVLAFPDATPLAIMEGGGLVNVKWHDEDYLHLKWHEVRHRLATPDLDSTSIQNGREISAIILTGDYLCYN